MDGLSLLLSISTLLFSLPASTALSGSNCPVSSCSPSGPQIRFPFYLRRNLTNIRCGYPGFRLSCNFSQTILTLPESGRFVVTRIDYAKQLVFINDPGRCLPNRIRGGINFSGTPFGPMYNRTFTFMNCSSDMSQYFMFRSAPVPCLSSSNYTVVVTDDYFVPVTCEETWRVSAPVAWPDSRDDGWVDTNEDLSLTWREPSCRACESEGGTCGFKGDNTDEIGCFNKSTSGLSRSTKYGITFGIGVPGLVCLIGLMFFGWRRRRRIAQSTHPNPTPEPSSRIFTLQPACNFMGLDGPTINSYPKTVIGDSGRLPKPNDGTCSICLAEYRPKETLRSIPECEHYFHATCIDEWLKMNATCPLCRNLPPRSLAETRFSPLSLLSSS